MRAIRLPALASAAFIGIGCIVQSTPVGSTGAPAPGGAEYPDDGAVILHAAVLRLLLRRVHDIRVARDWIAKNASNLGTARPTVSEGTVVFHLK